MTATFRDRIRKLSPPWLQHGNAEKYLYAVGLLLDFLGDATVAGVKLRFPGLYSFESLSTIARERRIPRGRDETDAGYAERLRRWRVDHRQRGGPYALLEQLHAYFAPNNFPIDLVYASGMRFRLGVDGSIERELIPWSPDNRPEQWARWWLFYHTDQWAMTPPTQLEIDELRVVPRTWNAAHPLGYIVLFPEGAQLWNYPPGHVWNESGTWNTTGPEARFILVD